MRVCVYKAKQQKVLTPCIRQPLYRLAVENEVKSENASQALRAKSNEQQL